MRQQTFAESTFKRYRKPTRREDVSETNGLRGAAERVVRADGAFLSEARMWVTGTGADVMKHFAAPQVGGVFSAMLLTLLVIPAIYAVWRWHTDVKRASART